MDHIRDCAITEIRPCPANTSLHGEEPTNHWWSGWPGAICLKCGDEDKMEICMSDGCKCPCHDSFWKMYEEALKKSESHSNSGPDGEF